MSDAKVSSKHFRTLADKCPHEGNPKSGTTRSECVLCLLAEIEHLRGIVSYQDAELVERKGHETGPLQRALQTIDAAGALSDWINRARPVITELMQAYERRIRTDCTPEQLAKEPWRCMEYIGAEELLRDQPKAVVELTLAEKATVSPSPLAQTVMDQVDGTNLGLFITSAVDHIDKGGNVASAEMTLASGIRVEVKLTRASGQNGSLPQQVKP